MRDFSSRPQRRRASAAEKALLALAAVALAASAANAFSTWREGRAVRARLLQAQGQSQAATSRAQAFESRHDPAHLLATQALLTAEAPPSRIVSELSRLMPGDVRLDGLKLAYGSRVDLELRVSARSASSYDAFLDRLERSPSFSDVLPGDENREGEVRAVVHAAWRGPGA